MFNNSYRLVGNKYTLMSFTLDMAIKTQPTNPYLVESFICHWSKAPFVRITIQQVVEESYLQQLTKVSVLLEIVFFVDGNDKVYNWRSSIKLSHKSPCFSQVFHSSLVVTNGCEFFHIKLALYFSWQVFNSNWMEWHIWYCGKV